ncbi:hypothetical protein R5R35_004407 [Gryllus longicercus]|uniref:C2H2-type domain-containing protein n=1 Tax=Gryllus longicercus TaxID=2509291 RepID=A0AAN9Z1J8_9ORTH
MWARARRGGQRDAATAACAASDAAARPDASAAAAAAAAAKGWRITRPDLTRRGSDATRWAREGLPAAPNRRGAARRGRWTADTGFTERSFRVSGCVHDYAYSHESVTCNVCDRSFSSPRQLAHHQQKKRHFGCSACDSLFPSLMALEHHKEEFEHWSGDDSPPDNSESEEDTSDDTVTSEELERLL